MPMHHFQVYWPKRGWTICCVSTIQCLTASTFNTASKLFLVVLRSLGEGQTHRSRREQRASSRWGRLGSPLTLFIFILSSTTRPSWLTFTPCHSERSASVFQFVFRFQRVPPVNQNRSKSAGRSSDDIRNCGCAKGSRECRVTARRDGVVAQRDTSYANE